MKKVLKGWLIDNSVTTDNKTDKILLLASAGSLTLDDVLEEMQKQDTGLRPETLHHSVTLYNGYTDTLEKMLRRLRYDLFYLEHRSWWFDFKILVKTFLNIAFGKKF